ncbi:peroxiredoxin-like family protein [Chitinilyticum litopenaei]|uniref:peroxiredoxin-like family protein n=1 Tax=Chitinilyticum litopenaei TaxID=1121276 RepID=UPI00040114A4|nr:peroxiredoxin-like family protein [Chitinilyticum litopenaei]
MKLSPGTRLAPLALHAISGASVALPDPGSHFTHLQFRRFAGCPICNLHLHAMAARNTDIRAAGIRQLAVFHSSADEMRQYQAQLPFDCIADPDKRLYRQFGVESHWLAALHPQAMLAGLRGLLLTRRLPGKIENGIAGLPADFLLNGEGKVIAAHYGSHADDHWSVDTLLALAR